MTSYDLSRTPAFASRPFGDIPREQWDALARRTPDATPFSAWAFHRAWWDAYGENAHEETLVVEARGGRDDPEVVAIVPLMHRHEVEPSDAYTTPTTRRSSLRLATWQPSQKRSWTTSPIQRATGGTSSTCVGSDVAIRRRT